MMNFLHPSLTRLSCAAVCLLPSLLMAHPGHYHPDETDEFDFLRATFLHSHGAWDYILALIVISSVAAAFLSRKPVVRIAAVVAATGALALMPTL